MPKVIKPIKGVSEAMVERWLQDINICEGWQNSKGCMAEFEVARIYGKEIIME